MRVDFKATGMDKARNMMIALGKMGAAHKGLVAHATDRKGEGETGTNADVMGYLADGGRDIGPSEDDAKAAAEMYIKHVEAFLRLQTDTKKPPSAQRVNNASGRAFRAAGKVIGKILTDRVDKGEDMDGQVKPVGQDHAAARAIARNMPDDTYIVLKDTGQLLADLAAGRVKLVK